MLSFSKQQFSGFEHEAARRFYMALRADLRGFLAERLPDMAAERADARITQAFGLCHAYGFASKKQITRLSYILVTFPSDFERRPQYQWLAGLLKSRAAPGVRLDRIAACIKAGG